MPVGNIKSFGILFNCSGADNSGVVSDTHQTSRLEFAVLISVVIDQLEAAS